MLTGNPQAGPLQSWLGGGCKNVAERDTAGEMDSSPRPWKMRSGLCRHCQRLSNTSVQRCRVTGHQGLAFMEKAWAFCFYLHRTLAPSFRRVQPSGSCYPRAGEERIRKLTLGSQAEGHRSPQRPRVVEKAPTPAGTGARGLCSEWRVNTSQKKQQLGQVHPGKGAAL